MAISTEPARVMERPAQQTSAAVAKLAGGGTALLAASVAGNALSYGFGIFLARFLGTEQFGLYALGLTFFNLLALFTPLALDVGLLKFVSTDRVEGKERDLRRIILHAGVIAVGSGLLASVGLILFAPMLSSFYEKPALSHVLSFFAVALPFVTLSAVLLGALQAFQTVRYTVWIKYVWEPAGKFLLAGLAFALGWGFYGILGGIVLVFAVSAVIALRCLRRVLPGEWPAFEGSAAVFRTLAAFSAPLIVSNLFGVLAPRSDMLILGYWVNADQIGIYNAAFQTSAVIGLILGAFDTAVAPLIGSLVEKETATLQDLYHFASRWALTLTLPIFVLMAIWNREILSLFGSSFTFGAGALMILAAAQLFNTATGSTTSIILMHGYSRMIMMNSVLNGVLLIGLNMMLIPKYGILGAASGSALCQILISIVRVGQVWRLRRILPFSWSMAKPVGAALIAIAVGWSLKGIESAPSFQWTLSASVLLIFSGVLFLFGFDNVDHVTAVGLWRKLAPGARVSRRSD